MELSVSKKPTSRTKTHAPDAHRWEDGTYKSQGNAFTSHGYVPGSTVAPTPNIRKRGPRSAIAFGQPGGTILGMGSETITRTPETHRPQHIHRKAK